MEIRNSNNENLNKLEIINRKQNSKIYDLEERTLSFAKNARRFFKNKKPVFYTEDVIRSYGSIGANYIEANESLNKKDFLYRIRIGKKEANETRYWLEILSEAFKDIDELLIESIELQKILGSIYNKTK